MKVIPLLDTLFERIGEDAVTAVLFVHRGYSIPPTLDSYKYELAIFELSEESIETLQIIKTPQIRIYKKGSEKSILIGEKIFQWENHVNRFQGEIKSGIAVPEVPSKESVRHIRT